MKFTIAGDHYTVETLNKIESYLRSKSIEFNNAGTMNEENKVSLQEIIPAVCKPIVDGFSESGILVCGTGAGVEIGANKFKGIRASLVRDSEQAKNARVYDNSNVLCLGSWYNNDIEAILDSWIKNKFDGDEERTQMLKDFEEWR
jgi:ribose 5-phosphate isomerase B